MLIAVIFSIFVQLGSSEIHRGGILYPRNTETRQVISLDGLWNFIVPNVTNPFVGFENHWYRRSLKEVLNFDVQLMPVPASYNDITTDSRIRDHVGLVWYDRFFFVPKSWEQTERVWIRFGSVSYAAQVWINGELVMSHEIGHLPFAAEITSFVKFGKENLITVACDNTLLPDTIPQGKVEELVSGRLDQTYTFDFFNYAGIDRPVFLYTTPKTYIDDISIATVDVKENIALLEYNITVVGDNSLSSKICRVSLIDKTRAVAFSSQDTCGFYGVMKIENPNLWWPYLMHDEPGYLYSFQVDLLDKDLSPVDQYFLPVGIRTLTWTNSSFLINNKPLYLHGFGRHEDSDIRGKGLDLPLVIKDHNLIKWIGANAYRTSHYPYAEEIMDIADEIGIMIIDECPSVNTEEIIQHIKSLDKSRPTTIVEAQNFAVVESSSFVDIISFNRYNGWYQYEGDIDVVSYYVIKEAASWHDRFKKPVIMQEYGADTMEGLHFLPAYIWSEEYQMNVMSEHFKAFDYLRSQGFFIGEFIWNFADFKTAQTYTRVGGNKKGIFTRNRQPKSSAFHLRRRYWGLAKEYNPNVTLPDDLNSPYTVRVSHRHTEL
ncbi:unnamed protein product [Diabrotica balteata]|uniref:Beta-glucuronidase n=1 Tax=Diabrotica balteata TaxID=107213 RepID=A0A9N9XEM3_DIABA|nr:unnamed protein product [Diabrotica balteata]